MKSREISRSKIGPFSLACTICTDPYKGIGWKYQSSANFGIRHKSFGNYKFNPVTDRGTCHRSLFQAYKFAMHFRTSRCDITDYASV